MTCYIGNNRNLLRTALLAAVGVVPSTALYRVDSAPKLGGGRVALAGAYTGASDATFDVEIVNGDVGSNPQVSQPIFAGVGNGQIVGVSAASPLVAQTFVITLEDLGTETRAAYVPFQAAVLRAKLPGPAGDQITVAVDPSGLVRTVTDYALQSDLAEGVNDYIGDAWNFGAATINADGTIPDSAPRISFGEDPAVYRAYRKFESGRYVYRFSPAPVRGVQKGARIYAVTGSRTVRISNGTDTDVLPNIVTLYDCLSAIRSSSTLVEVDGVIANDRLPNGQGVVDLGVWTEPYVQRVVREGTDHAKRAMLGMRLAANAPTEELTIVCSEANQANGERWRVSGDVSGELPDAQTGVAYDAGPYRFVIPAVAVDPNASTGEIIIEYLPTSRSEGQQLPNVAFTFPRLGIDAHDGEWNFVYTARPPAPCSEHGVVQGGPREECLGIEEIGGATVSENSRVVRLQRITGWLREFILQNTYLYNGFSNDIDYVKRAANILRKVLGLVVGGTLESPVWQPNHEYDADEIIEPIARNGLQYAIVTAGESPATEPTWGTVIGEITTDGAGVEYRCIGRTPLAMWDVGFEQLMLDAKHLMAVRSTVGAIAQVWRPGMGTGEISLLPTVPTGHWYVWESGDWPGSFGTTEPVSWPTDGGTVTVGDFVYRDAGPYGGRQNSAEYAEGDTVYSVYHGALLCLIGGETAASVPAYSGLVVNDEVVDGEVLWKITARFGADGNASAAVPDVFYSRYEAIGNDVLAHARVEGNFDSASAEGDGCWPFDDDATHWWVYQGQEPYLPVFNNLYYHASVSGLDEDGKPYNRSTREFGFGLQIGCEELALEGDSVRVRIRGVGAGRVYQGGDRFTYSIARAMPLALGGGQLGNDTLTWSVVGSVLGRLSDYQLVTTADPLATYSDSGFAFGIVPGAIPFGIGARFTVAVEGGQLRWRKNAGAWSSAVEIADSVPLSDGIAATFVGGRAPSWVALDRWTFRAEAVNGVDNLRQPTDAFFAWAGPMQLTVTTPAGAAAPRSLLLADHAMPADAVMLFEGSDDDFATSPVSLVLPWSARHIYVPLGDLPICAKYRLSVDLSGRMQWGWLGDPLRPTIPEGHPQAGVLTQRWRLPGVGVRAGFGGTLRHERLTREVAEEIRGMLDHACTYDDRRYGVVPNDAEGYVGLVTHTDATVDFEDKYGFAREDAYWRRIAVTLQMEPVP